MKPTDRAEANTNAMMLLTNNTNQTIRLRTTPRRNRSLDISTRQIYIQGVWLESFNSETWTLLKDSDLVMKVYGHNFHSEQMLSRQRIIGA